jgi:mRNA interferase RelE/StbE
MYQVLISRSAERQLKKLSPQAQRKVAAVIMSLAVDPRPYGSKKLSGTMCSYRIRIGDYRAIYDIYEREVVVSVLKVGHRRDVYRSR